MISIIYWLQHFGYHWFVYPSFFYFDSAVCLFEQKSSDVTVTSDDDESKRGFTAAFMLPLNQGLLCVTADQEFLLYSPIDSPEGTFEFVLKKRLVGNNGEILDMKFLGDEEQFIAVATNTEQVLCYRFLSIIVACR